MAFPTIVALLISVSPGGSTETTTVVDAPAAPSAHKMDALGIPLVSYNSDLGFGIGAVGGAYLYKPGYAPYQHAISAQVFFSQNGAQNHFIRYDGPKLLGPFRVEARAEFRREIFSPFFGSGNLSAPDYDGKNIGRRFSYDRTSPGGYLRLRVNPFGDKHPFQIYGGYSYRDTKVTPFAGSVLEETHVRGIQGGKTGSLLMGAVWDTRNNEYDTSRGGLEEISVRASDHATGSDYSFVGITLSERRFIPIGRSFVFAQRLTVDALWGDVPFFELPNVGGLSPGEGLGGLSSVRGLERQRYVGNIKAFSNSELRFYLWSFPLFGQPLKLGGLAFVDVGRVWDKSVADGPWYRVHPGVGGGLRATRGAAVVRVDYGLATERARSAFYVTFGQMF